MVKAGKLGLKSGQGFFSYRASYADKGQDKRIKERDKKHMQLLPNIATHKKCYEGVIMHGSLSKFAMLKI